MDHVSSLLSGALREEVRAQIVDILRVRGGAEDFVGRVVREALLRPAQAFALAGISVPQGYRLVASGDFPKPLLLASRRAAFSPVRSWPGSRLAGRRVTPGPTRISAP